MSDLNRRKQMIYRSNHRGIKEMDIVLGLYADAHVMELSAAELDDFARIMDEMDRDLFSWFTGEVACPDHINKPMFEAILAYATGKAFQKASA